MKTFLKLLITGVIFLCIVAVYYFYPDQPLPANARINKLVVWKSQRKMMAYQGETLLKTYSISLGKIPVGDKQVKDDKNTPEGSYTINDRNPYSVCYKNLGISYPNESDRLQAKKMGKSAGGDIKIHGMLNRLGFIGKFHRWKDWTSGCIAVTNQEMEELYRHVITGAKIEINP